MIMHLSNACVSKADCIIAQCFKINLLKKMREKKTVK